MYTPVPTTLSKLDEHRPIVGDALVDEVRQLAGSLRGARILHLSITSFGTVVAETIGSLVPLMADLGLRAEWQVIRSTQEFQHVYQAMYRGLGGAPVEWTTSMHELWLQYSRMLADRFDRSYDFVIVHDPQPAGILSALQDRLQGVWVWHCHLDLTEAQPEVWGTLRPNLALYRALIFDLEEYRRPDLASCLSFVIQPAIDPLSPKHMELPASVVASVISRYGVDPLRPLICQISPFDRWHDVLGVIEVYGSLKNSFPELQLVLLATMTTDDAESRAYFQQVAERAEKDPSIVVLSTLNEMGHVEVNAFQRAAQVVLLRSLRKGFGLAVSEALWKGRPVVAGKVGGIPYQVVDGETGYLVESVSECAERVGQLLSDTELAEVMGRQGREHVRRNFLVARCLRDYLRVLRQLVS
ncbi:MAG: glycosyltransferase [Chloroflexi bacterium]|nr:glycosyltransferase [Chloroflexota bacterium]